MKGSLYPKLAWDGLRKNRQLAWPYLLTCVGMVATHYILCYLGSPAAAGLLPHGGSSVTTVMVLGSVVALAFSAIFLFYTYSFLNRRRAREFGLYNVLGMGKRDLARIILWENLIAAILALAGGLMLGMALSKLAELGLVNLLGGEVDYRLRVDAWAAVKTALGYGLFFALNAVAGMIRTARSSAVNLMKAENVGEKPPKGNWLLALLGFSLLAAAYLLALGVQNPVEALGMFFIAVLMVIAATYLLMIAGSVWLCRMLQRNRGYYYRADHFVSVSSMAYRMKRNGAGLASICIIATMVLVILSSTTCLWFGADDAIRSRAPRDINVKAWFNDPAQLNEANLNRFREAISACAAENGAAEANPAEYRYAYLTGTVDGGEIQCDYRSAGIDAFVDMREIYLISADDYAAVAGEAPALAADEAALLTSRCKYGADGLTLAMGDAKHRYRVASVQPGALEGLVGSSIPSLTIIVPDLAAAVEGFISRDDDGQSVMSLEWQYSFDTGLSDDGNLAFERTLHQRLEGVSPAETEAGAGYRSVTVTSRVLEAADFRDSFAGLLFIGILLSAVFLLAAVLIIYYKQVSEGYEDARRFDIMQKVGMTKPEIRRSIASQLLIVFALPLAFAGLHLTFAFPMIRRVLTLFALNNMGLFVRTTLISFAAFAVLYWIVYRLTSGVYYRIVSGAN